MIVQVHPRDNSYNVIINYKTAVGWCVRHGLTDV